jgi:hypothetical protein
MKLIKPDFRIGSKLKRSRPYAFCFAAKSGHCLAIVAFMVALAVC